MIQWKPITVKDLYGGDVPYTLDAPNEITETFLLRIQEMPRKNSMTLEHAVQSYMREYIRLSFELSDNVQAGQLCSNWLSWISELGYHIALTGDEYTIVPDPPKAEERAKSILISIFGYRIMTTNWRPPVLAILPIDADHIKIKYETGETETASRFQTNSEFILDTLLKESLLGEPSPIKKFSWAA